jgi:hypothetical protein
MLLVQDCVCVVAPNPFRIQQLEDFDPIRDLDVTGGDDVWYARPLLFFTCTVCPTGHMGDTTFHKDVALVFFNTFEPIILTPESCMQKKGVPMLYERAASQVPSLYVCPVENVLGRVLLIPCYLSGNSVNKIPHCFRGKIPREAAADSSPDSGTAEPAFRNQHVDVALWKDLSSSNLCGSSCGIPQKKGCRNPGLVAMRLFGAGVMQPGKRELPLRSE